jgi:hypothetical protein
MKLVVFNAAIGDFGAGDRGLTARTKSRPSAPA